jgi:hypothetical protein
VYANDTPCYRNTPEDIVGCCDQTLRIMSFAFILETALGIEIFSNLFRCRQVILRTVESKDRHPVPKERRISRPQLVGKVDGFLVYIAKNSPWDLIAGKTYAATVDGLGFGPYSATLSIPEKLARFDINSLALPACGKRENKRDQLWKGEFTVTGKVRIALLNFRIDIFRDKTKKRL